MKIHINLLSIVLILLFSTITKAQDSYKALPQETNTTRSLQEDNRYKQEAIYLKTSFWGARYVKNGVEYRLGYMGKKIKKEFDGFPAAQAEFKKYQKQLVVSKIVGLTGIVVAFVGLSKWAKRSDASSNPDGIPPTETEAGLYLGGMTVGVAAATWGTISSNNSLQKAIFLRNQTICEGN